MRNEIKKKLVKNLKQLKIFDKNYDVVLDQCVDILYEIETLKKTIVETNSPPIIEQPTSNGIPRMVKNPLHKTLEDLRTSALSHLKELGLTPASAKKMQIEVGKMKDDSTTFIIPKM